MNTLARSLLVIAGLLPLQSPGQMAGWDMAVAQKWADAKVVKYRAEGVHKARTVVVYGPYGGNNADVTDRLTVEFTWDNRSRKVVGPVTVVDGKSEIGNIKSDGTNCPPPQLKGEYEHFQTVSHSMLSGDQIQIKGTRTYPAASVSQYPASCSMRAIPGGKQEVLQFIGGADPAGLGGPTTPGGPLVVAADRKSFTVKGAEKWVWTLTPTLVQ
jgi:hypothetical protein